METYLLQFDKIKNLSAREFIDLINSIKGAPLKDLKLYDLSYFNGQRILPGIGVYVFKDSNAPIYVGKCSSSSFIERIPKHFDSRKVAWFHRLLELIALKKLGSKIISDDSLLKASDYAFENTTLILINFSIDQKVSIKFLEKLLRIILKPLNKFKNKKLKDYNMTVAEYIDIQKNK